MYTILIVDDERPAQTFLKAICQKYCPAFDTILLSGSADDALRLMAQQHVHVLVTDISMPGINGIELAQRVRQLYPRTHTVIVSGYAEFEFARGAIQAGVDDYLLKPVEIQSFRQILDRIRETLDAEANNLMEETLTRLLCGEAVDEPLLCSLFSSRMMRFALVRQGNLFTVRFAKFRTAQLRQVHQAGGLRFMGAMNRKPFFCAAVPTGRSVSPTSCPTCLKPTSRICPVRRFTRRKMPTSSPCRSF